MLLGLSQLAAAGWSPSHWRPCWKCNQLPGLGQLGGGSIEKHVRVGDSLLLLNPILMALRKPRGEQQQRMPLSWQSLPSWKEREAHITKKPLILVGTEVGEWLHHRSWRVGWGLRKVTPCTNRKVGQSSWDTAILSPPPPPDLELLRS